jgi:predicted ATPase/signal transduction histidine kinase
MMEQRQRADAAMPANGYSFEVLRIGPEFTLYRGRASSKTPVLGVALTAGQSHAGIDRLTHENAVASEMDSTWAARPLGLSRHQGRPILLLEDDGASEPLDIILERTRDHPLGLSLQLDLARDVARAVGQLHAKGLLHRDIKPANILVSDRSHARLTGFGIATRQHSERLASTPPEIVAGTLAYMAPEQTGRMNRSVDARSDLYSLGVTLYELFAGVLPFYASDPMEWAHCHIARQPSAPSANRTGLPAAIDRIVLKLLAKNPEDRYRTAKGVETDLQKCLAAWAARARIDNFPLGERDVSDSLQISEKLYGREEEIHGLLAAFDRVIVRGGSEVVLLSGYSGIGKSSLVNELHKVLVPRGGLFGIGKFDQYKRDIPYATLAQAFQGLVRQLLNRSDGELSSWGRTLQEALTPNGQLMVSLIPELGLIIGDQPRVPQVDAEAALVRFHEVFERLLSVFATAEHPLVLFIDDLQWLDASTLEVLERLVTRAETRHLMFIGAFRDNEVSEGHPLAATLSRIRRSGVAVCEIALQPLQREHLAQLCADALHTENARTHRLAELLHEKTGGNPFFATQFISELARERLLSFDQERRAWHWDIERIRSKAITDNVADLMATKLLRLSLDTRDTLAELACLGNGSSLRTLALIRGISQGQVRAMLGEAVEAGLIGEADDALTFVHDRIQEACYELIPQANRSGTHLRIGKRLLSLIPADELEENVFDLINQFDRGGPAFIPLVDREPVAEVYLKAGKRAKASTAYTAAQAYFRTGRELLGEDCWGEQYALTFVLERNLAECEIVSGEMDAAETRLVALARRARGLHDEIDVACLSVHLYFTTGRNDRAVQVALTLLPKMGITWTAQPSEEEVRREYVEMRERLAARSTGRLLDMPVMDDPACISTMALLTELFPAAYAVNRQLLGLVLLRMTNLSLAHGNCESSSVAYSGLNMVLGPNFGDYTTAFTLGQLACDLVDHRGMDRYKARVYSCFAAFAMPWIKHVPLCEPLMRQAFRLGSAMGDKAFAAYNCRNLLTHLLMAGLPLPRVQREIEQIFEFTRGVQLGLATERFIGQLDLVRKLRGLVVEARPEDEEWARQNAVAHPGVAMMVCYYWVFRLQERYFAGDMPAALAAADRVEPIRWAMCSTIEEAEYDFYAALACSAVVKKLTPSERERRRQELKKHHDRIASWARSCPENFANREALVSAEIARINDRQLDAQRQYERAVRLAQRHGFLHNEALANELAGHFYHTLHLQTAADAHLQNARACYEQWGAAPKVAQIDAGHPQLRAHTPPDPGVSATIDAPAATFDVEAVDKASQTLSSEMVLPSLLEKLMRLTVEHAGAERGLLIIVHAGKPYVEAKATTGQGSVEVTVRRTPATSLDLPQSALYYVLRTHQRVALDDASADEQYASDEYVRSNGPRSVLCLPIFKEQAVIGVLYLENNLATRAFTPGRVAVLDFLASQAAIWLENARLYSELRRSETWLREAQFLSATGSFYWHVPTGAIEFSDQMYRIYELDPRQKVTPELLAERFHPDDLPLMEEMREISRGTAVDLDYVFRARMPDQSVKYLHIVAHASRNKDGEAQYIGSIQDITQRHLAEEALGKARAELAHVARVTTLGVLTASIAHEVNQPLLGIVTNASTCLRMLAAVPPNIEGARQTAQRSIRDGHRAADVIKRLRALFGQKVASFERVDLNEATREVMALSATELQGHRVLLNADLAGGLSPVMGDRVQLQQVILNLVFNALDALMAIQNRARQVTIRTDADDRGYVRLSVRDTGVGLDPKNADRLFEAFYTTKVGGMGMGLSVSRAIIESHHGRLWAQSNDGPGATFFFSLPAASRNDRHENGVIRPPTLPASVSGG